MSGSLVGGVVGAVIGFSFGNPQLGWMIGSTLGSLVDNKRNSGPDMTDLRPQASEYGRPIPIVYSVMAVGGNIIWASDLVKTSDGDGGGKGGGGGSSTGPTYAANFAVLICEGDGNIGLGRIWAGPDKRLIYDPAKGTVESGSVRFYDGAGDQMPDPLMESYLGAGNVPAYRGFAYVVFDGFDVSAHDGNRIPFLTVEVGRKGNQAPPSLGTVWFNYMIDAGANWLISYHGSYFGVLQYSKADMSLVHNWQIDGFYQPFDSFLYDAAHNAAVYAHRNTTAATMGDGVYFTVAMGTGVLAWHKPFTPGAGEELRGALQIGSNFVFVFAVPSGGAKLYYVATDTHTLVATQTVDAGGGSRPAWVYGPSLGSAWAVLENGSVVCYTLNPVVTASIPIGTAPAGFAGSTMGAVDPNNGHLWLASRGGGTLYYGVYDTLIGLVLDSTPDPFFALSEQPWCFVPGVPNQAWLCGEVWLAKDQFLGFNSDDGTLLGPAETGVYHGTNALNAVMWNDIIGKVQALRYNGFYATGGGSPPSLPYITAPLGGSDASLNYQTVAEVVTDLSLRAGLTVDDIDVAALADQVDGYILANQMACQDAVKALMPAHYFDAVESQGKVKFVKRGGGIVVEIPDDDLGAHPSGEDALDLFESTRIMDEELPRTLSVNYVLAATKYSPATKYARRLVGYSGDEARLDMPMVFTDQKAQEISDVNLHTAWVERLSFKFSLPLKYAYLEPTDIVGIGGYTMRITKMTQKGAIFDCEAVRDDSDTYTPHVIVTETPPPDETVGQPTLTLVELM